MKRLLTAACFAFATTSLATAQTAEEAVAYILFGKEEAQISGVTTKRISPKPAIFETKSSFFASRLTVSSEDQCRFKATEVSKVATDPRPSTVALEFDFSSATPPVKTTTSTAIGALQVLVQVTGLKIISCSSPAAAPDRPTEMERQMEKMVCDMLKKGMPVTSQYSAERATKALTLLRASYCKAKAS